ncbi:putative transmembrane protein [Gregarina niphandrodes]|uniref:Transmembrane protein n=1 Tax=Gregarina niphandrodes TaxID=110365 RepID=A0A023AXZ4_GRENI|nr:putative transmembrane protein [Gregarina niphandrodes]EZG43522.1 putative transmembrane protein [Gregarina niphandrodes]|eukprot:XP_011133249.1 putative transmembrane protein [Gregarina niphandrodes]
MSLGVLYVIMTLILFSFVMIEQPNATKYTGWSYHWFPRALQYYFGVWCGMVGSSVDCHALMTYPSEYFGEYSGARWLAIVMEKKVIVRWLPDIIFGLLALIYFSPPHRNDAHWSSVWMWRSMGVTCLEALLLVAMIYGQPLLSPDKPNPKTTDPQTPDTVPTGLRERTDAVATDVEAGLLGMEEGDYKELALSTLTRFFDSRYSVVTWIWSSNWFTKVAPGYTNVLGYLLHFPLVWQPMFDKNKTISGQKSLLFMLVLWWLCLIGNCLFSKIKTILDRCFFSISQYVVS